MPLLVVLTTGRSVVFFIIIQLVQLYIVLWVLSLFSDYHWWYIEVPNWYGPILRIGGDFDEYYRIGQFVSMHSQISVVHAVIGSRH